MKKYKYIGLFKNEEGNEYSLKVYCLNMLEAFILLTAEAINAGKHYQLKTITNEKGEVKEVGDVKRINSILK